MARSYLQKLRLSLDSTYLKNRLINLLAANPPLDDAFEPNAAVELNDFNRVKPHQWNVQTIPPRMPTQYNGNLSGLWVVRNFFDASEISSIHSLVDSVTDGNAVQGMNGIPMRTGGRNGTTLEWHEYHPGRLMLPFQPHPSVNDENVEMLQSLISTNGTDPLTWPSLQRIIESKDDERFNSAEMKGAFSILRLQQSLSDGYLLPKAKDEDCLFIQVQQVERGGAVGSHKDPIDKGGKCIVTAVLGGQNEIQVGDVKFMVEPGDVYGIEGEARFDVEHEVFADYENRLSLTLRFGNTA
eukprot:g4058.t1